MTPARPRWLAITLAWICLIFFSSTSLAGRFSEQGFHWLDEHVFGHSAETSGGVLHFIAEKSVHVTLFVVLGILLSQVYRGARLNRFAKVVITGLVIGSASEFLQSFFPDRDPAVRDVLINLASTAIGGALATRSVAP